MTHSRFDLATAAPLNRANYYVDIEVCTESQRVFVLAADLVVEVYDLSGRFLSLIRDFAELFYTTDETLTGSATPLLAATSTKLILADPLTGTVAIYSLDSRRVIFVKETAIEPYSVTGDPDRSQALISCAKTAAIYRVDIDSGVASVVSTDYRKPRLVCAMRDCFIDVDTSTATLTVRHSKSDTTRTVSFWPRAMRREWKAPGGGSWVFGVDCACADGIVVILQGRGGHLVPSFWRVPIETLIPESFQINEAYQPIRVASASDSKYFFLCLDQRAQYCLCTNTSRT